MKHSIHIFILFIFTSPISTFANTLLERELFNARNGESYICQIQSDGTTEIINDGVSMGKFPTQFATTAANVKKWMEELKSLSVDQKTLPLSTKNISQYTQRGLKQYSIYSGTNKITYYKLQQKQGSKKSVSLTGSVELKVKNVNENRLRGQTDIACKNAQTKI